MYCFVAKIPHETDHRFSCSCETCCSQFVSFETVQFDAEKPQIGLLFYRLGPLWKNSGISEKKVLQILFLYLRDATVHFRNPIFSLSVCNVEIDMVKKGEKDLY